MSPEFWAGLIEKGGTVAVAVFAIWVLAREFKRQLQERDDRLAQEREDHGEERATLVAVINRNTEAWIKTTNTMSSVAAGIAVLTECVSQERDDLSRIRVLLARRPCIGDSIVEAYSCSEEGEPQEPETPRSARRRE